jgi:hypothetical protein
MERTGQGIQRLTIVTYNATLNPCISMASANKN